MMIVIMIILYIHEADVHVGAVTLFARYVRDDALSIGPLVVQLQVMRRLEWTKQTDVLQVLVGRKERLAQVLRTLQVFHHFDELLHVLRLHFALYGQIVVDNDFVHAKQDSSSSDLIFKNQLQLRNVDYDRDKCFFLDI